MQIFGLPWPNRPEFATKKKQKNGPGKLSSSNRAPNSSDRKRKTSMLGQSSSDILASQYATSIYADDNGTLPDLNTMFTNRLPGTPVFVDPLDSSLEMWWPAIIVNSEPHQLEVCYLEDHSFSECGINEVRLFTPFTEPFTNWFKKTPDIINNPAIRRAIAYYEWRFLAPIDRPALPTLEYPEDHKGSIESGYMIL